MTLLDQLEQNKGTVSSALGKELAKDALSGKDNILSEALQLVHYDHKNVRSGAAKIIEKVAESKPELVASDLSGLLECMNYPEPQTRWMVLHIAGLCAKLQPNLARELFGEAINYLDKKHGTVLNDRAITYLGYLGAVSKDDCNAVFPHLINSFKLHPNRITRIFESFLRMINYLDDKQKKILEGYIKKFENDESPSVRTWVKKVMKKIG